MPPILRNPYVHYRIHKCPPPVTILSQINAVHASQSHFWTIHFNITLPSTSVFHVVSFPQVSPPQLYAPLPTPIRATCPPISFLLIWSPEWYLVRGTEHKGSHYVVSSTPVSPRASCSVWFSQQIAVAYMNSNSRLLFVKEMQRVSYEVWNCI